MVIVLLFIPGAERLEFTSAAFVETAEHFVIFQTEYLDTYDQALHSAYEKVSEDNDDPVRTAVLCACKHKHNLHHSCVADCKSADTHEGECIGKVAQDNLEQFEDTLYDKHALFFWHNFGFFLNQVGKRLLEEDQKQRNTEHDGKNSSSGNCMTGTKSPMQSTADP